MFIWQISLSFRIRQKLKSCLNGLEQIWRKETLKELNKKLNKASTTPQDKESLQYRVTYEEKMLEQLQQNPVSNTWQDIVRKMINDKSHF